MPAIDDADSTAQDNPVANPDNSVPVDMDEEPIVWHNLKATIKGTLSQVAEWCETTGYLITFLKHHAVATSRGVIFDSKESFAFYNGDFDYPHDAHDPARAGPARVALYNADNPILVGAS